MCIYYINSMRQSSVAALRKPCGAFT